MSPTASRFAHVDGYEQPTWIAEDASNLPIKTRRHRVVDSKQANIMLEASKASNVNVKPLWKGADADVQGKKGDTLSPSAVNTVSEPKAGNNDDETPANLVDNEIASTGSPGSPRLDFLAYLRIAATKRPTRSSDSKSLDLFEAAKTGDLESVKYWIEKKGVDVNSRDTQGTWKDTPLHLAAEKGQLAIAKYLVDKNADVNAKNFFDETPLHEAVVNGRLDVVKYLVMEKGVSINAGIQHGNSLLHLAVENGHLAVAKYLVEEQHADVNARNIKGITPLYRAAERGGLNIANYLVEKGANVNDKLTIEEFSPLHVACDHGNLNLVKYFVEDKGIDVNVRSKLEYTPLMRATFSEQIDIVKYLVGNRKTDVSLKDFAGQTALHYASEKAVSIDFVKYLVVNGKADVNVKDLLKGDYPIHKAARQGNLDVVKFLAEEKAVDVNAKNNDGESLLHLAAQGVGNYQAVIRYLVDERKADVNALTSKGDTPLHAAIKNDQPAAVQFLVDDMKANIRLKNNEGLTPLALARKRGISNSIIKCLEAAEITRPKRAVINDPSLLKFRSIRSNLVTKEANDDPTPNENWPPIQNCLNSMEESTSNDDPIPTPDSTSNDDSTPYQDSTSNEDTTPNLDLTSTEASVTYEDLASEKDSTHNEESTSHRDYKDWTPSKWTSNQISAACKPTSFIHSIVYWLAGSVSGFLLPSPSQVKNSIPYPDVSSSLVDGMLILFDVGVRKFYGNNYKQPMHDSLLSPGELLQRRIDPVALSVVNGGAKRKGKPSGGYNCSFQDVCPAHPFGFASGVTPKYVCVSGTDIPERVMLPRLPSDV